MRDPAYDGEEPIESDEDYERAIAGHTHIPEQVHYSGDPNRYYECAKCGEPMYEVPYGVGEYIGA